jgi:hypothetical protein
MSQSAEHLKSTIGAKAVRGILWTIVLAVIVLLVLKRHENTGYFNWRSKMWGDQAGYYVYAPAFFIYGFDGSKLPENIVEKTGEGFTIDERDKIITRYTSGVAMLQSPVFLVVHAIAGVKGQTQDGFSGIYHLVSGYAAILYAFLGLMLLWQYLLFYFKKIIAFLTLVTLFFGTNLLYYTIDATGMSHIYSFFLFALLLFMSKLFFTEVHDRKKKLYFIVISFIISLIVLIRPTNLVFVGLVFLLDVKTREELRIRFIQVFTVKGILILIGAFILVFLPQMLYWKYSSGSYITDSYEGYGFTNWASPQIIKFLFSTNNGLFLYNPIYIFIVFSLFFMIWRKETNGYYILAIFLGLIYLFSSWFIFSFGCGFGSRNFVEYTTVFALPLGYFYQEFLKRNVLKWSIGFPLILVLISVNLKLIFSYNKCFIGGDWDWEEYSYLLRTESYTQSFPYDPELIVDRKTEYTEALRIKIDTVPDLYYRRALIEADVKLFDNAAEALLILQIETPDTLLYWNKIKLVDQITEKELGTEQQVTGEYWLPRLYTTDALFSTFIWNIGGDSLHLSEIKVILK